MSKSELSDLSRINLTDEADQILNKIKKAKTDPLPMPSSKEELEERLEAKNLIGIYASLTDSTLEKSIKEFSGKNFSEFKKSLSDLLIEKISPISSEINRLNKDISFIDKVLTEGGLKAHEISSKKVKKIKEIIGF